MSSLVKPQHAHMGSNAYSIGDTFDILMVDSLPSPHLLQPQDTAHHGVFSLCTITDTHSVDFSRNRVVLVILCRGARSTASVFQEQYRRAVKEAIPVVVFVTVHQCLITLLLVYQVYSRVMTISGRKSSLTFREIHCSYPLIAMLIPLFLLAQSQLRQKINLIAVQLFLRHSAKTLRSRFTQNKIHYLLKHELLLVFD